jgi:serine-type D-Ala-D-Ala carboxypeptidase/endopeptidase (penicillin-binding protein 4)
LVTEVKENKKEQDVPFVTHGIQSALELLPDTIGKQITYLPELKKRPAKLTTIFSQPTDSLLQPMMYRSDNFYAEQSLLMVSQEKLGEMSDRKIIDTLLKTDLSDLPQKPRWVDGSGLSRYNLFTPNDFVVLLQKMQREIGMKRLQVILPTGGKGTLSNLYKQDSNYIFAKTGTLSGVVALSGYLYTKKNKLLIFSVLINNHTGSAGDIRRSVETFLTGIRNRY